MIDLRSFRDRHFVDTLLRALCGKSGRHILKVFLCHFKRDLLHYRVLLWSVTRTPLLTHYTSSARRNSVLADCDVGKAVGRMSQQPPHLSVVRVVLALDEVDTCLEAHAPNLLRVPSRVESGRLDQHEKVRRAVGGARGARVGQ